MAQRLADRIVAMNRFILRSAKQGLPFFEVLRNTKLFNWGPAQQKAFDDLKSYLLNLTTLASLLLGESLLYMSALPHAVSTVLVKETEEERERRQHPIYFISEPLEGPKKFYTKMEKIAYTVVMASRK